MKRLKFQASLFEKSSIKGIFDKTKDGKNFLFDFIKFSKPKSDYLINNGVIHVAQSWKEENGIKQKILHTGLIQIQTRIGTFLYGNNLNQKGKKDFILISVLRNDKVKMYVVKNRNPRNKSKFAMQLINQII